jgi:hypothetical protein
MVMLVARASSRIAPSAAMKRTATVFETVNCRALRCDGRQRDE